MSEHTKTRLQLYNKDLRIVASFVVEFPNDKHIDFFIQDVLGMAQGLGAVIQPEVNEVGYTINGIPIEKNK